MLESHVSKTMLKGLRDVGVLADRIESSIGSSGMSDINALYNGREIWIESKVINGKRASFRTFQGSWITQRISKGSKIFVVARRLDEIHAWWPIDLLLLPRNISQDKKSFTVPVMESKPLVTIRCKPKFDWEKLRDVLFSFEDLSGQSDFS